MKNLFYILIVILLLNLSLYNAYAAQTFTLEECISLALKNNDSIKASLSDMEMHAYETSMYYSEFFPKFSSNIQYTLYDREPSLIIEKNAFSTGVPSSNIELPAGTRDTYAFTLSIKQPIYTGGYLTSSYENAKIEGRASEAFSAMVKDETVLKVKQSFYYLLKTLKMKETGEQLIKHIEERLRVVKNLHAEGLSIMEEVLKIEAELAEQKLNLFKIENTYNTKQTTLKNLLALDPDLEIVPAEKLEDKKLLLTLPDSKKAALNNRHDLTVLQYNIKSAEMGIEIAKSNLYPKSSAVGTYARQKETPLINPDLWTLMVTLEWDIFEWGKTKADVERAKKKYEKTNIEYDALKKDVMLDVEEKWFKVKETEENVKVRRDRFDHAIEYYKNAFVKHRNNMINTAGLLEAETYLIQSRNEYITSIYDLNIALAEFEFSISSDISPLVTKEAVHLPEVTEIVLEEKKALQHESRESGQLQDADEIEAVQKSIEPQISEDRQENSIGSKAVIAERDVSVQGRYSIQAGSFKNPDFANKLAEELKTRYPQTFIVKINGFNKVRILGFKTKEEGDLIVQELEKNFNLRPLLLFSR